MPAHAARLAVVQEGTAGAGGLMVRVLRGSLGVGEGGDLETAAQRPILRPLPHVRAGGAGRAVGGPLGHPR